MNVVLAIRLRRQRRAFSFAVTAALCFVVFFAIFFTWTFPANQATANWTTMPDNWSELRQEWEYSHAGNAIVMLVALCSVTCSHWPHGARTGRRHDPQGDPSVPWLRPGAGSVRARSTTRRGPRRRLGPALGSSHSVPKRIRRRGWPFSSQP